MNLVEECGFDVVIGDGTLVCYVQDEAILNAKVSKWLQCAPHLKDNIRAAVRQLS